MVKKQKKSSFHYLIWGVLGTLLVFNFFVSYAYWASHVESSDQSDPTIVGIGAWYFEDIELIVSTFQTDHQYVLALDIDTVDVDDKDAVLNALSAYGALSYQVKTYLSDEYTLLSDLLNRIISIEYSAFYDFDAVAHDSLYTGTVVLENRNFYGNNIAISNSTSYDVWLGVRSLGLKSGSYFQSSDYFLTGIDYMTIYHGALHYGSGTSFAFRIRYELASNPGVWEILQEGGTDKIVDIVSSNPMTFETIEIGIYEAVNIRFEPIISNTSDYINLDNLTVYNHVVESVYEVEAYRAVYKQALNLTLANVDIADQSLVNQALDAYQLLSGAAQQTLASEHQLLLDLQAYILEERAILQADYLVSLSESSFEQTDYQTAYDAVALLNDGMEKTALLNRLVAVQNVINEKATFLSDYQSTLQLTIETVTVQDRTQVENALADYYQLSYDARLLLANEKVLLNQLLEAINDQTPIQDQINQFRLTHQSVLALTIGTVTLSDQANILIALSDYDTLSSDAQLGLTIEKTLLDNLLLEISYLEATSFVEAAESSHLQTDLDEAMVYVTELADGSEKTALLNRLIVLQDLIDQEQSTIVINLIHLIPSASQLVLQDEATIINARDAYDALTVSQKALVTNINTLVAIETEYDLLVDATHLVIIAETVNDQAHVDQALTAVNLLSDGVSKTSLMSRINAVQDIIDVQTAVDLILAYFEANTIDVRRLFSSSEKEDKFLDAANNVVDALNINITLTNTAYIDYRHSTYTITITKNNASQSIQVPVSFI